MILVHKSTSDEEITASSKNILINNDDKKVSMIKDFGKLPSLRKIVHEKEILEFITFEEPIPPLCYLDKNILDFDLSNNNFILSDHDLYYINRAVIDINGIATLKILPQSYQDFKNLNSNKIKILPLPLKDINYKEVPLTYKIKQIIQKMKREKLSEIKSFNSKGDYNELKIDVLFDNEELAESFKIKTEFTCDIYSFPHLITIFSKASFTFLNVKNAIKRSLEVLKINNDTGYGFCMVLTNMYLFIAPLVNPFYLFKDKGNEIPIFADPMYYAGVFTLPEIESEWDETIERKRVEFDLLKVLEKSSNFK